MGKDKASNNNTCMLGKRNDKSNVIFFAII
jgi:hypothetical protein